MIGAKNKDRCKKSKIVSISHYFGGNFPFFMVDLCQFFKYSNIVQVLEKA